jgi:RHS repeat-associated protein
VNYTSGIHRDILIIENGSFEQRYVYGADAERLSAEFGYADGTGRGTTNAGGEYGENLASDFSVNDIDKVWYRVNMIGTSLFAVDDGGEVIAHAEYDAWGDPLTETYTDTNYSGLESLTGYTGYVWDVTLELYFAQNRFYDADEHRFTQQDPVKGGGNWYVYVDNNPLILTDPLGLASSHPAEVLEKVKGDLVSRKYNKSTYYSTRSIFEALGGSVEYNNKTRQATLTVDYDEQSVSLDYNMYDVKRGFLSIAKNNSFFPGTLSSESNGINDKDLSLLYYKKKAYASYGDIYSYFVAVWCETNNGGSQTTPNMTPEPTKPYVPTPNPTPATDLLNKLADIFGANVYESQSELLSNASVVEVVARAIYGEQTNVSGQLAVAWTIANRVIAQQSSTFTDSSAHRTDLYNVVTHKGAYTALEGESGNKQSFISHSSNDSGWRYAIELAYKLDEVLGGYYPHDAYSHSDRVSIRNKVTAAIGESPIAGGMYYRATSYFNKTVSSSNGKKYIGGQEIYDITENAGNTFFEYRIESYDVGI